MDSSFYFPFLLFGCLKIDTVKYFKYYKLGLNAKCVLLNSYTLNLSLVTIISNFVDLYEFKDRIRVTCSRLSFLVHINVDL